MNVPYSHADDGKWRHHATRFLFAFLAAEVIAIAVIIVKHW